MRSILLGVVVVLCALVVPSHADRKFHKVSGSKLKLRVKAYDGDTNGTLQVQVRNTTDQALEFSARGLYFVPDGDPDEAPQRLGAVGPFVVEGDDDSVDTISIAAGGTVSVELEVFCIDSHRDSPTSRTPFTVAKKRMPKKLYEEIEHAGKDAAEDEDQGAYKSARAKAKVQDAVWETRDKAWVKLSGEGDQEDGK